MMKNRHYFGSLRCCQWCIFFVEFLKPFLNSVMPYKHVPQ